MADPVWQSDAQPVRRWPFVAGGIVQIALPVLLGLGWLLLGLGVVMCTDSGNVSYCNRLGLQWLAVGAALAVNVAVGVVLLVVSGWPTGTIGRRVAVLMSLLAALVLAVVVAVLAWTAAQPGPAG